MAVEPSRNPRRLIGLAAQVCVAVEPSREVQACAVHRLEDYLRVPRLLEALAIQCCMALSRVPMRSRTAVGPSRKGVQACAVHLPVPLRRLNIMKGMLTMFGEMGVVTPFTDCSHRTGVMREDIRGVRYRNDNEGFRPVTTDPYDVPQTQSPSWEQARSPGARRSLERGPDRTNRTERWREMFAGGDDSFQTEEPSSQERVSRDSPARNAKGNADDYDQDPSWLLQQSHESAPDRTHVIHGRKTIRTHDGQTHDGMRGLST
jgi:hypothetical protein